MTDLKLSEHVSTDCPKCGYQFSLKLSDLNKTGDNTQYCPICKKDFAFKIMFFGQGIEEKQQENEK